VVDENALESFILSC